MVLYTVCFITFRSTSVSTRSDDSVSSVRLRIRRNREAVRGVFVSHVITTCITYVVKGATTILAPEDVTSIPVCEVNDFPLRVLVF